MDDDQRAALERRFWGSYTNTIIQQGIKPSLVRWHVLRAKSFIKAFPGLRLADLGPDTIAVCSCRSQARPRGTGRLG